MGLDRKSSVNGEPKDKFLYAVIFLTSVQSLKTSSVETLSPSYPKLLGTLPLWEVELQCHWNYFLHNFWSSFLTLYSCVVVLLQPGCTIFLLLLAVLQGITEALT